jgi:hypothetical protein
VVGRSKLDEDGPGWSFDGRLCLVRGRARQEVNAEGNGDTLLQGDGQLHSGRASSQKETEKGWKTRDAWKIKGRQQLYCSQLRRELCCRKEKYWPGGRDGDEDGKGWMGG